MKILLLLLAVVLVSCSEDIDTPLTGTTGQRQIEVESMVRTGEGPYCKPDGDGVYHEEPIVIAGQGEIGEHVYALGGGCVTKSVADTWQAALANGFFHWNESNLDNVTEINHPGATRAFAARHSAGPPVLKVRWTMNWYHILKAGPLATPEQVLIQYAKVKGSSHIRFWEGVIELTALTDNVTSVILRNEIQASQTDVDKAVGAVRDLLAKLRL